MLKRTLLNAFTCIKYNFANMSVFVRKLNPATREFEWNVQDDCYDYHQEVARSAFADMLHDKERNVLYEQALSAAIKKMHSTGRKANILDIGTGTGLLSMMAVRNGADSVVACEGFKPMSNCALKIIADNGFQHKIKVIPKRSTKLTVGEDGDLQQKCNILVTEVFDTELIGEGALSTFSHAHKHLLEVDSIVVPESATIFAQIVECPLVQNWNKLKDLYNNDGELLISMPDTIRNCPGSAAVHDIQLSQLPLHAFKTIVSPIPVLRFDWSGRTPFVFQRSTINSVKSEHNGLAQAVFMWWELQMDTEGKIILSCAPQWAHPLTKLDKNAEIPWRDHWMQAVYYFPKELKVKRGEEVHLITCHDEYSLWFNLRENLRLSQEHYLNPICECGVHAGFSRTRIGQINDAVRIKKYLLLFEKHINSDSVVLILSDSCYIGLAAAKFAKKVFITEPNQLPKRILEGIIQHNNIKNAVIISDTENVSETLDDVDIVFGEPYLMNSLLPWDNLHFHRLLLTSFQELPSKVEIFPKRAIIKAVAMCFKDLHKIRMPLGICEGFEMDRFDQLIAASSHISDDNVEAQPLWEYPGVALSEAVEVLTVELTAKPENVLRSKGNLKLQGHQDCNGIAFWVDWDLDGSPKNLISTGPTTPIEIGQKIEWDKYTRQGVYLFPSDRTKQIDYDFFYDAHSGVVQFYRLA